MEIKENKMVQIPVLTKVTCFFDRGNPISFFIAKLEVVQDLALQPSNRRLKPMLIPFFTTYEVNFDVN